MKFHKVIFLFICFCTPAFAATPIELAQKTPDILRTLSPVSYSQAGNIEFKEIRRMSDFNQILHIRFQQTYKGYDILGADAYLHIPKGDKNKSSLIQLIQSASPDTTMNGVIYNHLDQELSTVSPAIFTSEQRQKAAAYVMQQNENKNSQIENSNIELKIYMDKKNNAHWVYQITQPDENSYLIDAESFKIYAKSPEVMSAQFASRSSRLNASTNNQELVSAGGFGGNLEISKLSYDGYFLQKFEVTRKSSICYMENTTTSVSYFDPGEVISFPCEKPNASHNNLFWSENLGMVNGGYSPVNDAMYAGSVISKMYKTWYGIDNPTGSFDGRINIRILPGWDDIRFRADLNNIVTLGDGRVNGGNSHAKVYPLTTLDAVGAMVAKGFTYNHAQFPYWDGGESIGIDQAFAVMGGEAVKYFVNGSNDWKSEAGIYKNNPQKAAHYLADPTKACESKFACHVDHIKNYKGYGPYQCGIYEKAFYLMATSPGWNTKKVFDVLVKANMNYWTSNTNFHMGACGILKATIDYGYDVSAVGRAFEKVGIATSGCF